MANRAEVSYSWEFSAAHRLMNHPGKCRRLHGHNYGVTIEVEGALDSETGMVIDFDVLKQCAKQVDEVFDHRTILYVDDPIVKLLQTDFNDSLLLVPKHPTVEVICELVWDEVRQGLIKYTPTTIYPRLTRVTISETETGVASITL